jgi:hypothetical protein
MPRTYITWQWEEAFDKFGFGDGDGWNGTHEVEGEIESLGYTCETESWGCHNYMIFDIKKDGKSILFPEKNDTGVDLDDWLPEVAEKIIQNRTAEDYDQAYTPEPLGYEEPRAYLPDDIIEHLDKVFNEEWEDDYYG